MILKRLNVEVEEFDKERIEELKAEGFEPLFVEPEEVEQEEAKDLAQMTVKELRALAASKGIKLSKALNKQGIIEVLEEADD